MQRAALRAKKEELEQRLKVLGAKKPVASSSNVSLDFAMYGDKRHACAEIVQIGVPLDDIKDKAWYVVTNVEHDFLANLIQEAAPRRLSHASD